MPRKVERHPPVLASSAIVTERVAAPALGVILAGGLSRRMGGGDKTLRLLAGRTLLDHARDRFAPQCGEVILNANGDPARFAGAGMIVVPDDIAGHPGPLAGIVAALDWVAANRPGVGLMASVTSDAPCLPADFVARLQAARTESGLPIACARTNGRLHPIHALWPVDLRDPLRQALRSGERQVSRVAARHGVAVCDWPTEPFDPFVNVNTPEDLTVVSGLIDRETGRPHRSDP